MLGSRLSHGGFMYESCWVHVCVMLGIFPRTSATHFACYVGLMCEACWFHVRVMAGFMCESH